MSGTVEIQGLGRESTLLHPMCAWDARAHCHRAPAIAYVEIVRTLTKARIPFKDQARQYMEITCSTRVHRVPHPYQTEALQAWKKAGGRGILVLPTGSGKTHVAVMAIEARRRSTLVVVPTLDLMRQWYDRLRATFALPIGLVGGGDYSIQQITVATYDSAYLHMEHLGARFGLIIFDECHHLPGPSYALASRFCLAPFRLGLTATPERSDGRDALLHELIGPIVFHKDIRELSGEYLADYEVICIQIELSSEERLQYESERAIYIDFLKRHHIRIGQPRGWGEFIFRASQSAGGQRALLAYQRQRAISFGASAKLDYVDYLLHLYRKSKVILFSQDNATAYRASSRFLIPAITHQTKVKERSEILAKLANGEYGAVATSRVLNEGIDVPDVNVAIVISGSASVREHVQRLGRILRKQDGKRAILYELVSNRTAESFTSERRREHSAYR
ncbi:helicase [Pajaroellobacter abortibovis]|uniref:DNA 3'-5' helicase n=1 Tax=Pajaroellobacter abortibovis TaxID=1882918 RepID=A0A1L6MZY9_9BACT|nr:helicase [Pajaroellobacter abortibovis]